MVKPSSGFQPQVTTSNGPPAKALAAGTPQGGGTPNAFRLDNTPGGPPAAGTPGSTPSNTPGGPAFNRDTIADNIADLPYSVQVRTLAASITGDFNVNDKTLIDKPALEKFIQEQSVKTNLSKGSQYVLAQARLLYSVTFDATDRWGAAKAGGALDGKVNVGELTDAKFADLSPYF